MCDIELEKNSSLTENRQKDQTNDAESDHNNVEATKLLVNSAVPNSLPRPSTKSKKSKEKSEYDRKMTEDINKLLRDMPPNKDMTCGFWFLKGPFLQRLANQTTYVILYGLVGCALDMTFSYFSGVITTVEKRFKIPSKNTGIISVGNDFTIVLTSAALSYYAGKGHRPRWIGIGLLTTFAYCVLSALLHFLYGPGEDALALTSEFGALSDVNATSQEALEVQNTKSLCHVKGDSAECKKDESNLAPQIVLFIAQFISGIGYALYSSLGVSYMDDNAKKSKAPALLTLASCLRMLGPVIGYTLASFCLRLYVAPELSPVIDNSDPRWLGAWWLGWLIIAGILIVLVILLIMFPKELPRAGARRIIQEERSRQLEAAPDEKKSLIDAEKNDKPSTPDAKPSFKDMLITFKGLITNKTFMFNNISNVCFVFGYMPYWIFAPKYIEIEYRQSAATSSMVTGTVALFFTAVGVLASGAVVSKFKPSARVLVAWNIFTGFVIVAGMIAYAFIGCPGNEQSMVVNIHESNSLMATPTCNSDCNCDYVQYDPVCGENGMTYISPCHAGCRHVRKSGKEEKTYYDCACIPSGNRSTIAMNSVFDHFTERKFMENDLLQNLQFNGEATSGACPADCFPQFMTFLAVMCFNKLLEATGYATTYLIGMRCVQEKDKSAAMGLNLTIMSLLSFTPSPIFFGWLIDQLCLVWGKTCTKSGNCWFYDLISLRFVFNLTATCFVLMGTLFNIGVWYHAKDLKIFDDEVKEVELQIVESTKEEMFTEKSANT